MKVEDIERSLYSPCGICAGSGVGHGKWVTSRYQQAQKLLGNKCIGCLGSGAGKDIHRCSRCSTWLLPNERQEPLCVHCKKIP